MAEFVHYNAPQSTCSQRVRYALHAKGITFDFSRELNSLSQSIEKVYIYFFTHRNIIMLKF